MNNELLEALTLLEKEKNISKDTLLEAIEQFSAHRPARIISARPTT